MKPPFWTPGSAYYSNNVSQSLCIYVITWYIAVAVRKTDAYSYNTSASWSSPKWLASRIGPPNFWCPGAAPGKVINLKLLENVSSLVLGKVRKSQHRSSSRFWDSPEKPEGRMKTTPLPLIGLKGKDTKGTFKKMLELACWKRIE